jgi:transposase
VCIHSRVLTKWHWCLLSADIRSWLPPDHLAWRVTGALGELDMSRFVAAYRADGQGQAPYDPAMMLSLLFYCYFKGIRSSRNIKRACVDDVGCRVICGGVVPSHRAGAALIRAAGASDPPRAGPA